jgi:hypothetical protein
MGVIIVIVNKDVKLFDGGIIFLLILGAGYYLYTEKPELFNQDKNYNPTSYTDTTNKIAKSGCDTKWTVRSINKKTGETIESCQGRILKDGETSKVLVKKEKWR